MCFSMEASFGAGAVLLTIGFVAAYHAKTTPQYVLAAVPFLFGLQQLTEGMLWLLLDNNAFSYWREVFLLLFLIFAQVVWPAFLPLAMRANEKDPLRRKILSVLCITGVLTAGFFLYVLLFHEAGASIGHHHIKYTINYPFLNLWYGGLFYLIAAVGAPLVSSNRRLQFIGVLLVASYLVSRILYKEYLISVWCYFATVISLVALYEIIEQNRSLHKPVAALKT